jgi:G:T-mismatch repair DNA endonuclease (very short patch repair protein)
MTGGKNISNLCECGCGEPTTKINHTINKIGRIKGNYNRFLPGHYLKINEPWNKGINGYSTSLKGREFSKNHRKNISLSMTGKTPWNKGNGDYIKGSENPMFGKKHSEKTKEKIREARMKQKLPTKFTSIEIKIKKFLDILRIPYKTHKAVMGISQPDFFIEPNICIYCDGDYWHNLPEVIKRDKKINEILIFAGYKVLRLWENKINSMDVNKFKNFMEKYQ